jgi:hypothetical protein
MRVVLCLTILAAAVMAGKGSSLSLRNQLANALEGNSLDLLDADLLDANLKDDDAGNDDAGNDDAGKDDAGKDNAVGADEEGADDDLIDGCPPGYQVNNVTDPWCYQNCGEGLKPSKFYTDGTAPFERCVFHKCPRGFRDDGGDMGHCAKRIASEGGSYGRGVGTVPKFKGCKRGKCYSRCTSGKQRCLALCYKPCDDGYHAVGCNTCSQSCPPTTTDDGVSCRKPPAENTLAWYKGRNRYGVIRKKVPRVVQTGTQLSMETKAP